MSAAQLLAVVEVPREDRVRCQAVGCSHPVFRRIHVVRQSGAVHVYGSDCFKRLFEGAAVAASVPRYTSAEGRHLTEAERRLLIENTERLIEHFENEHQAELAPRAALAAARQPVASPGVPGAAYESLTSPAPLSSPLVTEAKRRAAEAQAKEIVRTKYGVDPELPGWRGLVLAEVDRIVRLNERPGR